MTTIRIDDDPAIKTSCSDTAEPSAASVGSILSWDDWESIACAACIDLYAKTLVVPPSDPIIYRLWIAGKALKELV